MSESLGAGTVWYRSLYWRIAVGLVALPGADARRAGRALHLDERPHCRARCRRPRRGGSRCFVASDLSAALDTDPTLDIDDYVQDQH
mgnify:CR=1 FL=1